MSDEQSWITQARKEFCAGTPFLAPFDLIKAGFKTDMDWCEHLENYRTSNRSGFSFTINLTRDTKPEVSNSTVRKQILNVVALHCNAHEWGLTATEVGKRLNRSSQSVYKYLVDLVDDGLLKRCPPTKGMQRNTVLYRIAGDGEGAR